MLDSKYLSNLFLVVLTQQPPTLKHQQEKLFTVKKKAPQT